LRCGDRILEFNGVNLRDSTAEQAAYELAKPTEKVTLIVQHDMERYREIAEQPGDSFYVRAQFDKMAFENHEQMELGFRRDDILHIDNTMFNGVPGKFICCIFVFQLKTYFISRLTNVVFSLGVPLQLL
jgi:hypothetical protein